MPLSPYAERLISEYLSKATRRGRLSPESSKDYRRVLRYIFSSLDIAGLEWRPSRVGEKEIDFIRNDMFPCAKPETVRWYLSIFNGMLKQADNDVVEKMLLGWPQNVRTNVDWLTPHEALALIRSAVGVERPVIHLELRLWFRRIEVRRLRTQDIKEDLFDVHGKGRCGGKWRSVAWGPDTLAVLMEWETERERMIEDAQALDPNAFVPEQWIIYRRGKHLGAYGNTAVDNIVASAARRAGIERSVSNHTLRRTGGRIAYYAGVPLVEIMEGMGHSSEKQTIRYLGLRVDELKRAQEKIYVYLQEIEKEKDGSETPRRMPERRISR